MAATDSISINRPPVLTYGSDRCQTPGIHARGGVFGRDGFGCRRELLVWRRYLKLEKGGAIDPGGVRR